MRLFVWLVSFIAVISCQSLYAQDDDTPEVYYPSTTSAPFAAGQQTGATDIVGDPKPSVIFLASQVIVFLIVLAGGVYLLIYYYKRGGLKPKSIANSQLLVSETKVLGNKQFLAVVEYGDQKMLLGVGPGMINHLCYLKNPYEEQALFGKEDTSDAAAMATDITAKLNAQKPPAHE